MLDEPTEGLDAATEAVVIARLRAWLDATGTGLILVSHRAMPLTLADQQIAIGDIVSAEPDPHVQRADRRRIEPRGRADSDRCGVDVDEATLRDIDGDPGLRRPAETA